MKSLFGSKSLHGAKINHYLLKQRFSERINVKAISIRRGESRDVMFTRELQPLDI